MSTTDDTAGKTPGKTPDPNLKPGHPDYNEALHGVDWGEDFGTGAAPGSKGKKAFGTGTASDGDDTKRTHSGRVDTFERGKE